MSSRCGYVNYTQDRREDGARRPQPHHADDYLHKLCASEPFRQSVARYCT